MPKSINKTYTSKELNSLFKQAQMASSYFLLAAVLAMVTSQALASDPSPLQDFCVADMHSPGMNALTFIFLMRSLMLNHRLQEH
jgi:CheY-like chemotaxis protein